MQDSEAPAGEELRPTPAREPAELPEWLPRVWRPAGSMSLAERWLRSGEPARPAPRQKPVPPPAPPRPARKRR